MRVVSFAATGAEVTMQCSLSLPFGAASIAWLRPER